MTTPTDKPSPGAASQPASCNQVFLRRATADDEQFLKHLYASTRLAELDDYGWDARQQEAFLDLQFRAQREQYRFAYPNADSMIVLLNQCPIGRLLVNRGKGEFTVVDIALMTEHRGAGIGTFLLTELLKEAAAAGKPVRLHVFRTSPTLKLYERLGFAQVGDDGSYLEMLCVP